MFSKVDLYLQEVKTRHTK